MLLSDQLHLSEKGHELYYDTLKNTFISIIEDYRRKN